MRKLFVLLLVIIFVPSIANAQKSTIPTFPDDDAELVDPGSLDVPSTTTTTQPTSTTSSSSTVSGAATTTTVPDSGTGTPTLPVVALSFTAAFLTMTVARFIHKKLQR